MNSQCKSSRMLASTALMSLLTVAGMAHAQVLGGGGSVVGGIGGTLSGGPRSFDGAFGGGLSGAGRIDSDGFGATREVRRHTLDRTQSTAGHVTAAAREDVSAGKQTALRAKNRSEDRIVTAKQNAEQAAAFSGEAAGAVASSARTSGTNAAAEGAFLGAAEVQRGTATGGGALASAADAQRGAMNASQSSEVFGSVTSSAPTAKSETSDSKPKASSNHQELMPRVDASGDAAANANASRSKHGMPRARASAEADGSASVSH